MAVDGKLRGCDLVRVELRDVFVAGRDRERISILQSKKCHPVKLEVTEGNHCAVHLLLAQTKMDSTVRYLGIELETRSPAAVECLQHCAAIGVGEGGEPNMVHCIDLARQMADHVINHFINGAFPNPAVSDGRTSLHVASSLGRRVRDEHFRVSRCTFIPSIALSRCMTLAGGSR
jgi:hypothetical protein